MALRCAPLLLAFALLGLVSRPAWAEDDDDEVPESRTADYSRYERETIAQVTQRQGRAIDPSPEGKTIEAIDVEALEVIEERDPAPRMLNLLHAKSRDEVIRRESLLAVGEPYRKVLVDETARNLRRRTQLSLVLALAVQGSSPGKVRLLLVTKDIWSLRLSWDVSYVGGRLERLVLAPTETNLLGLQHTLGAFFELRPLSYATSLRYSIPRVLGSRIAASAEAGVIINRELGQTEGSFGALSVSRPLYSTRTRWAVTTSVAWRNEIYRRYVNAGLSFYNALATPGPDTLPFLYRSNQLTATASATRSYGWAQKNDLTAGVEYLRRHFAIPNAELYDPVVVGEFRRRRVPTTDDRLGPFVQWQSYTSNFLRTIDIEKLALQEDVRLGHRLALRLYASSADVVSTRTVLGVSASAGYTVALGDGYASADVGSVTEQQPDRLADGQISADLRVVTPRLGFGRFVVDGEVLNRYRNYLNRFSTLGGEGRLRGWPSNLFTGRDVVAYNLEFRSRPVQILSCQLGGVVFYDVGDAADSMRQLDPKQGVGFGFRVLFPQLDRVVFRGDLGFPIEPGGLPAGVPPYNFAVAFEQAFDAD